MPKYYNDLRQLDTETMVWTKSSVGGCDAPSARYGHCTAHVDDAVVIFGGWGVGESCAIENSALTGGNQSADCKQKGAGSCFALQTDTATVQIAWVKPNSNKQLDNKYGHTMTAVGSNLFVFGGWNGKQANNDLIQIQLRLDGAR